MHGLTFLDPTSGTIIERRAAFRAAVNSEKDVNNKRTIRQLVDQLAPELKVKVTILSDKNAYRRASRTSAGHARKHGRTVSKAWGSSDIYAIPRKPRKPATI